MKPDNSKTVGYNTMSLTLSQEKLINGPGISPDHLVKVPCFVGSDWPTSCVVTGFLDHHNDQALFGREDFPLGELIIHGLAYSLFLLV